MKKLIGKQIGDRYQLKKTLGKSTGRRTFLATDHQTRQLVVIKLILFGPGFSWGQLKLFEREAATLQQLSHPAIPQYLDAFEISTKLGEGFALVQTYIPAQSLQTLVDGGRRFSESQLGAIAKALLTVLDYLHEQSPEVIHRDIKPSNILLADSSQESSNSLSNSALGQLYLVDFGAVRTEKVDGTLTIVGTYGYMPPEQFGGRAHPASDLYSLGATLIYLATGQHPAELIQDNLQIAFPDTAHLSDKFSQWLQQMTYAELSKRTPTAQVALQQLIAPHSTTEKRTTKRIGPAITPPVTTEINADFRVYSSIRELEIQYFQRRSKDKIHYLNQHILKTMLQQDSLTGTLIFGGLAYTAGIGAISLILLNSTMPFLSAIATLFPFWLIALVFAGYLSLVLTSNPARKIFMSMRFARTDNNAIDINLYELGHKERLCTSGPLRMVKMNRPPSPLQSRLDFVLLPHRSHLTRRLSIRGTFQEIQWLHFQLERWGSLPIEGMDE